MFRDALCTRKRLVIAVRKLGEICVVSAQILRVGADYAFTFLGVGFVSRT